MSRLKYKIVLGEASEVQKLVAAGFPAAFRYDFDAVVNVFCLQKAFYLHKAALSQADLQSADTKKPSRLSSKS